MLRLERNWIVESRIAKMCDEMLERYCDIAPPAKQRDMDRTTMLRVLWTHCLIDAKPDYSALLALEEPALLSRFLQMLRRKRIQLGVRHRPP
jgi:hypothetical protein